MSFVVIFLLGTVLVLGLRFGEFLADKIADRYSDWLDRRDEALDAKQRQEFQDELKKLEVSLSKAGVPVNAKPQNKPWAKDWDRCIYCLRSDRPHQARGHCHTCYQIRVVRPKRRSRC